MKLLYVPWRNKYVKNSRDSKNENLTENNCPFCIKLSENNDKKNFILARFKYNFIILNLHPYNSGHIMILPLRHIKNITQTNDEERKELMNLIFHSTIILQDNLKCEGINVGMNIGKASGAGIPSHLHMHLVPRWLGDTNFLPIIANTKTISVDLIQLYENLKQYFAKINV